MGKHKTFLCSYRFDGGQWSFEIKAKDLAEAESRIAHLRMTARLDGEHIATIPAGAGWLVRAVTWLRNRLVSPPHKD